MPGTGGGGGEGGRLNFISWARGGMERARGGGLEGQISKSPLPSNDLLILRGFQPSRGFRASALYKPLFYRRENKVSFNDTITILRDIIVIHDY